MNKIRMMIAIIVAQIINYIAIKKNGRPTHLSAEFALHIYKDLFIDIEKPKKIITVTGTNGKTTTTNLIIEILDELLNGDTSKNILLRTKQYTKAKYLQEEQIKETEKERLSIVNNSAGANLENGVISALIQNVNILGKLRKNVAEIAIFEVDERSSARVYKKIHPDYTVVTNILRDSIRRNASTDYIQNIIDKSIPKDTKMIINGDDIIASMIHYETRENNIYYGMDKREEDTKQPKNRVRDIIVCPVCNEKLEYEYIQMNHLGRCKCVNGHIGSPKLDNRINYIDLKNKIAKIYVKEKEYDMPLLSETTFNTYNQLAALSLLVEVGYEVEDILTAMSKIKLKEDRHFEAILPNGKKLIKILAKGLNPVSCSNVYNFVAKYNGKKSVAIIIDDHADNVTGTEAILWHYDVDFEFLNDESIDRIIVIGPRNKDLLVRMLLAGIDRNKIYLAEKEDEAEKFIKLNGIDTFFILNDMFREKEANIFKEYIMKHEG